MMRKEFGNLLLVTGSGKNVGKTSFVCEVIKLVANMENIFAIKITPHFHAIEDQKVILSCSEFRIIEENRKFTGKDTSKMLKAGAERAFLIQTIDEHASRAFFKLIDLLGIKNEVLICEAGCIYSDIIPGLSVFVSKKQTGKKSMTYNNWDMVLDEGIVFEEYVRDHMKIIDRNWGLKS